MLAMKCLTTKGKGWGRLVLTQHLQMRRESICALAAYHDQSPHSKFLSGNAACASLSSVSVSLAVTNVLEYMVPWCCGRLSNGRVTF